MVQTLGSLSQNKTTEADETTHKVDLLRASDKKKLQKGLSTSPVVVRKDLMDFLK